MPCPICAALVLLLVSHNLFALGLLLQMRMDLFEQIAAIHASLSRRNCRLAFCRLPAMISLRPAQCWRLGHGSEDEHNAEEVKRGIFEFLAFTLVCVGATWDREPGREARATGCD
jgi:hypothetical protein